MPALMLKDRVRPQIKCCEALKLEFGGCVWDSRLESSMKTPHLVFACFSAFTLPVPHNHHKVFSLLISELTRMFIQLPFVGLNMPQALRLEGNAIM